MNLDNQREVAAAWSNLAEPGDIWAGALRANLGEAEALAWAVAPYSELPTHIEGPAGQTGQGAKAGWVAAHRRWDPRVEALNVEHDLEALENLGGRLVIPQSPEWPAALEDLGVRCPAALWVLGRPALSVEDDTCVSIVGARAATAYGMKVTAQMAFDLCSSGISVISGGAYGIDAAAHRGALEVVEGRADATVGTARVPTVAIICGGLANLYPPGNEVLFRRILDSGGLIVAEVPPSFRPARWRFLERNRLIAAWSPVTVVPEAGTRSGAIATANRAVELGREVAALPGPVTSPASAGPHSLLKTGAALVENARDVGLLVPGIEIMEAGSQQVESTDPVEVELAKLGELERRVWNALALTRGVPSQNVARAAGVSIAEVGGSLLRLHMAGLAKFEEGLWQRAHLAA